ncbi:MAG: acyltransferase family protein [Bacteroidia bacterium]|nr:acyltransferase family protein [Bacteroidia bacterium]
MPLPTPRYPELDWLRVGAFALLIGYHAGMPFTSWGYHLENPTSSRTLELFMLLVNRWRLPLLFFISGAVVGSSLRKRTPGAFVGERMLRIGLPLVAGMVLFIVPLQIYLERVYKGQFTGSFWAFWPTTFTTGTYSEGNLSWHHLWYLAYVLAYSLLLAPLAKPLGTWAERLSRGQARLFLVAVGVLGVLVPGYLYLYYPSTHNFTRDWGNHAQFLLYFLAGYISYRSPAVLGLVTERRRLLLLLTLGCYAVLYAVWIPRTHLGPTLLGLIYSIVRYATVWFAILALVAWARHGLTHRPAWLGRVTTAVYPIYIFHQTATVAACFWVLPLGWYWLVKFGVVLAATFAGGVLGYLAVRSVPLLRPLFGLKYRTTT